jgi:hypothetical protein
MPSNERKTTKIVPGAFLSIADHIDPGGGAEVTIRKRGFAGFSPTA